MSVVWSPLDSEHLPLTLAIVLLGLTVVVSLGAWLLIRRISAIEARLTAMTCKPLLEVQVEASEVRRAMILTNHGQGSAVITRLCLKKDDQLDAESLKQVMYTEPSLIWDQFSTDDLHNLEPGASTTLGEISIAGIVEHNGVSASMAQAIINRWDQEIDGVSVRVEYADTKGNPQPPCFRSFGTDSKSSPFHQVQLIRPLPKSKRGR